MKYIVAVLLLALCAIAMAEDTPKAEKTVAENAAEPQPNEPSRDKRGLLLGTYAAPYTYPYAPSIAYSSYSLPYAYSSYPSYRYYYGSPYYYHL